MPLNPACTQAHFNALFPVKINKMWNLCLKLWFFPEPLIKGTCNKCQRMFTKACQSCTCAFWVWHCNAFVAQNEQNVTFFVWNCNSAFVMGRSLIIETLKHAVRVKWHDLKEDCCICHHSHFQLFPVKINKMWNFLPEIVIFHEPIIVGTCKKCHWI